MELIQEYSHLVLFDEQIPLQTLKILLRTATGIFSIAGLIVNSYALYIFHSDTGFGTYFELKKTNYEAASNLVMEYASGIFAFLSQPQIIFTLFMSIFSWGEVAAVNWVDMISLISLAWSWTNFISLKILPFLYFINSNEGVTNKDYSWIAK